MTFPAEEQSSCADVAALTSTNPLVHSSKQGLFVSFEACTAFGAQHTGTQAELDAMMAAKAAGAAASAAGLTCEPDSNCDGGCITNSDSSGPNPARDPDYYCKLAGGRHSSSCADVIGTGGDENVAIVIYEAGYIPTGTGAGECSSFDEFFAGIDTIDKSTIPPGKSEIQACFERFGPKPYDYISAVENPSDSTKVNCIGYRDAFDACDSQLNDIKAQSDSLVSYGLAYAKHRIQTDQMADTEFFSYDICNAFTAEAKALFAQEMAEYTCQMEADCIGGMCLHDDGPRLPGKLVQGSAECTNPDDAGAPGIVHDSGEEGSTVLECNKDASANGYEYFMFKEGGDCFFVDNSANCDVTIFNEHFDLYKTTSGLKNSGSGSASMYQANNKGNFWCNIAQPTACTDAVKDFNYGDGLYARQKSYEICDAFAAATAAAEADAAAAMAALEAEKVCEPEISCDSNGCKQDRAYGEGIRMAQGTIYGTGIDDTSQFIDQDGTGGTRVPNCANNRITDTTLNYDGCIPTMEQLETSGRYIRQDDFADRKEMAKYCDFQCIKKQIPTCTRSIFNLEDLQSDVVQGTSTCVPTYDSENLCGYYAFSLIKIQVKVNVIYTRLLTKLLSVVITKLKHL